MNAPHTQEPATLLLNGQVLVTGTLTCIPRCYGTLMCHPECSVGDTTELYDPSSNSWTNISGPSAARFNQIQARLPDGKVLVAGGYSAPGNLLNSAELYDPASGTWSSTGGMSVAREFHKAAVLLDGRVLVAGGLEHLNRDFLPLSSAEMYDPASGVWTSAGSMSVPRYEHSATTLQDGRVLVAGGTSTNGKSNQPLAVAELYDPASGTWTSAASMNAARLNHRAVLLPTGEVLVAGGIGTNGRLASAELYDPVANRWTLTGSMGVARSNYSLTLLPDGRVLAAGGFDKNGAVKSTGIYDPSTGRWTAAADLQQARGNHSATLLENGKVLVAGGDLNNKATGTEGLASAEVYGAGPAPANTTTILSAASFFDNGAVAPDSIAAAFGAWSSTAGTSISVEDGSGALRSADILASAPGQINFTVPSGTAPGIVLVTVNSGQSTVASGYVLAEKVAPGVFSADSSGQGLAAAYALVVHADGSQSYQSIAQYDTASKQFVAAPIDVSSPTDHVFLILFGTGIRGRSSPSAVHATVGSADVTAAYAGPSQFPGVDQVNLPLPASLAGSRQIGVTLSVDGFTANTVQIAIK